MNSTGCLKISQPFWTCISQRWFYQINCPFSILFRIAIQFFQANFCCLWLSRAKILSFKVQLWFSGFFCMIKWKVISFSYYDIIMSFFLIQKYFKATLVFHLFRFSQRMRKKWNKEISVSYSIWQQDGASSHTANPVNESSCIFWELILTLKANRR